MAELHIATAGALPEISAGDDLAGMLAEACGPMLEPGAIVCVAHKLVSKAEGRVLRLADVEPSPRAEEIAARHGKDARHVEVILRESAEIIAERPGVMICRTHHGFSCANAGVDQSNAGGDDRVVLLPVDPDGSARAIRTALSELSGTAPVGVLISDSFGRPWRVGQADVAIGLAGITPIEPHEGMTDRDERPLVATLPAVADEIAAAADLARTKAGGEGAVVIRGLGRFVTAEDGPGASALLRTRGEDLFR